MELGEFVSQLKAVLERADSTCEDFEGLGLSVDNAGMVWIEGNDYYEALIRQIESVRLCFKRKARNIDLYESALDATILEYLLSHGSKSLLQIVKYPDRVESSFHPKYIDNLEELGGGSINLHALDVLRSHGELFLAIIDYVIKEKLRAHFTECPELEYSF